MVKIYQLKANCPTFWEGDLAILNEDGDLEWLGNPDPMKNKMEREKHWKKNLIMFNKKTLEAFNILENWFVEVNPELVKKVWPFEGCRYWCVTEVGVDWSFWYESDEDFIRKSMGNVFLDKESAEKVWQKIQDLCALKKMGTDIITFVINKDGKLHLSGSFNPEYYKEEELVLNRLMENKTNVKEN